MKNLLLMLFQVVFCLHCSAQIPLWLPGNGLVAWYPLTGNANDSSGNGNNGIVYNSAPLTTDRFGNANAAYQFNGTNQYIGGSCTKFPATARSVSLWYNSSAVLVTTPARTVFGYGGLTCGQSWIQWIRSDGYGLSLHCGGIYNFFNTGPLQNNSWHHWLITTDGTPNTRFYVDGQLVVNSTNFYNNTYVSGRDFTIGGIPSPTGYGTWTDGNVSPFQGKVDDVAVYDRALSDCEVRQIFHQSIITIGSHPANTSAANGSKVVFSAHSGDTCITYRWQQDCGLGFVNLTNAGPYSGTSSDKLTIDPVSPFLNNCFYRCIISSCRVCADTSNTAVLTVTPVGIEGSELNGPVSLFPNPFSDEINISNTANAPLEIVIYDVLSREILRRAFNKSISIKTEQLPAGMYVYFITDKKGVTRRGKMLKT